MDFRAFFSTRLVTLHPDSFIERDRFLIDYLLVRIHFIIVVIGWTDLVPWEFEFLYQGSLKSTFLDSFEDLVQCGWRGDGGWGW